jgi:hypothetical protein
MRSLLSLAALSASLVSLAIAAIPLPVPPSLHVDAAEVVEAAFEQLIDHTNPDLGTFEQRYWYNAQFWEGPGSPVCMLLSSHFSSH